MTRRSGSALKRHTPNWSPSPPFRDVVPRNEAPLRRIAENTTRLRWMLTYIDFIVSAGDAAKWTDVSSETT